MLLPAFGNPNNGYFNHNQPPKIPAAIAPTPKYTNNGSPNRVMFETDASYADLRLNGNTMAEIPTMMNVGNPTIVDSATYFKKLDEYAAKYKKKIDATAINPNENTGVCVRSLTVAIRSGIT